LSFAVRCGPAALLALAWACQSAPAAAQPTQAVVDIPAGPLSTALVRFAVQAGISINTGNLAGCGPVTRRLQGRLSATEGLNRLLSGTGCTFRMIDPSAAEIVPAPKAAPLSKPPSSPSAAERPPTPVDEVLVAANRRSERADGVADSVSTAGASRLAAQGLHDANDIALNTPAMMVSNLGAGRDKIILRGLSDGPLTGRTQALVGIYLDGARITFNAPDPDLRLVDMQRVEVLRGPQGALYGAGSLGGVLYLATAQPDSAQTAGWISATLGATQGGANSGVLEGMVNQPLFDHRGAVRLVAYREDDGGYIDDSGLGLKNVNHAVRDGFRLSSRFDLNSRWSVSAGLTDQSINAADTQYAFASEPAYRRRNQVREPHDNDFAMADLAAHGGFDWGDLRLTTALIRHELASRYDASLNPPVPAPPGPTAFDDTDVIRGTVTEATATSPDGARIPWLMGAMFARTQQGIGFSLTSLAAGDVLLKERRRDSMDEAALFGEITLPLTARTSITIGGRAFFSRNVVESLVQQGAATQPFQGRLNDTGFAPKLVLAFKPSATWLVYIQAAEGYRGGGFNTTGPVGQVFGFNGAEPARQFSGDQLWSFEAGAKATLLDGRLRLSVTAYDEQWRNVESDQLLPSGLPFTANIGDARNVGLEVEAAYQTGGLEVRGALLLDAPELNRVNPAFAATGDLALALAPDALVNASARYTWRLAHGRSLELAGRLAYVGHSRLTFYSAPSPSMGDYLTSRVAVMVTSGPRRLSLAVDNLGGAQANTFAYGNSFTFRSEPQVTPLRPRTVSLQFAMDY
jgi:iron complex outermembrane receptor protein